jgi:hypothetical protein
VLCEISEPQEWPIEDLCHGISHLLIYAQSGQKIVPKKILRVAPECRSCFVHLCRLSTALHLTLLLRPCLLQDRVPSPPQHLMSSAPSNCPGLLTVTQKCDRGCKDGKDCRFHGVLTSDDFPVSWTVLRRLALAPSERSWFQLQCAIY